MKKIFILLFLVTALFQLSANDDIEILRFIVENESDTIRIYKSDILWMTEKKFELTQEAHEKLKCIKPSTPSLSIFWLNTDFEWVKMYLQVANYLVPGEYIYHATLFAKNLDVLEEDGRIYSYSGLNFYTAKKLNIPNRPNNNSVLKEVYLKKTLQFKEIEVTNESFLDAFRKYVIPNFDITSEYAFIVDIDSNAILITQHLNSTVANCFKESDYLFSEIDGFSVFFENLPPAWYSVTGKKELFFKEVYILHMDTWLVVKKRDYPFFTWCFNIKSKKIILDKKWK